MYKGRSVSNTNVVSLATMIVLLVVIFALIGFVALSVLTGTNFGNDDERNAPVDSLTPNPVAAVPEVVLGTPNPSGTLTFRSSALGFSVEYPRTWRKHEQGLRVIFSPSAAGLDPDNLQDAAIWFGIPPNNIVNPAELLAYVQGGLLPNTPTSPAQQLEANPIIMGGQAWPSTKLSLDNEQLGGSVITTIAVSTKDEVGYFAVAVAPVEQWDSIEPTFRTILDSFQFTTEAVLRPTDATPPTDTNGNAYPGYLCGAIWGYFVANRFAI